MYVYRTSIYPITSKTTTASISYCSLLIIIIIIIPIITTMHNRHHRQQRLVHGDMICWLDKERRKKSALTSSPCAIELSQEFLLVSETLNEIKQS